MKQKYFAIAVLTAFLPFGASAQDQQGTMPSGPPPGQMPQGQNQSSPSEQISPAQGDTPPGTPIESKSAGGESQMTIIDASGNLKIVEKPKQDGQDAQPQPDQGPSSVSTPPDASATPITPSSPPSAPSDMSPSVPAQPAQPPQPPTPPADELPPGMPTPPAGAPQPSPQPFGPTAPAQSPMPQPMPGSGPTGSQPAGS